jgi:tetrahydromethanopterin S-methyltransferase subunit G
MTDTKTSRARVAFALLCGLAICCSVMYLTADAADEVTLAAKFEIGSGQDVKKPRSVHSTDVMKAGMLYTKTPDTLKKSTEGRERLLTFLDKVEKNIAEEVAARKNDIAKIRQQMAKNMELNAAARKKMKKFLLAKMAKNAKIAKDDLAREMRKTQAKFHKVAQLRNKRYKQTIARSKKTREIMRKNKAEGQKQLAAAVLAQQRALATLDQQTNAKIKQTNMHIAANAAAIKANAKKARDALDHAMGAFNKKMSNVEEEARKGRSKLAQQAAAQDKRFRNYANNKIAAVAAKTAAQFHKVRARMAKDRAAADAALSNTAARINAALAAQKALQDKRFAKTVKDIAAAKKEANDRVNKFRSSFKADILKLAGEAEQQQKKLNNRVTQLSGTVQHNKLEQAKLNRQVDAELGRMVKLGNKQYNAHLKKDKELHALMKKNKADTEKKMTNMAKKFYSAIGKIKKQMKRDRAHHERQLTKSTNALYKTLMDNKSAQEATNKKLTAATRRVELDAQKNLRDAKRSFASKIGSLTATVVKNEKKVNKKVLKLTGIVRKNAVKDAQGRAQLRKIQNFNKNQIKGAIADAIHKGEQRALQIEKKMKGVNAKTRQNLNHRITTEIGVLRKQIHGQILDLELDTKAARAEMKRELMFAIKSEATLAKSNLNKAVAWATGEFTKLHNALAAEKKKSKKGNKALKKYADFEKKKAVSILNNAVMAQNKALLSYKNEMCNEVGSADIKDCPKSTRGKMNKRLDMEAARMIANAKMVQGQMKTQATKIKMKLEAARKAAQTELAAAGAASVKRYNAVMKAVQDGVSKARKKSNRRFSKAQIQMANDRKKMDKDLAGAVSKLNDDIAQAAALEDQRFKKTVKNIKKARSAARSAVKQAKKDMLMGIAAVQAKAKAVESRILGDIQDVSAMIVSDRAAQARINKHVDFELKRLVKKSDAYTSASKRARGAIRKKMDEYKRVAHDEVMALAREAKASLKKTNSLQKGFLNDFQVELTTATKKVYGKMAKQQQVHESIQAGLSKAQAGAKAAVAGELKSAKKLFKSRVNTLSNAIASNARSYQAHLEKTTGVVMRWKEASSKDRANIRKERSIMETKLRAKITRAIQLGEAKMKAVQERAMEHIATEKKTLMTTISVAVENMADNIFATVQENRHVTADNFLSLKAYAIAAADQIDDYLQKGKGRNLGSIGDLLKTLSGMSDIKPKKASGLGFGSSSIPKIFSSSTVKVSSSVSKINGLVNQYVKTLGTVKQRWTMGLGKYLLAKLEIAMQGKGALEVDKIEGKTGNFVFMNGHAVGLSSRLSDFETLAVRMPTFEGVLAKLTKVAVKKSAHKKMTFVKPPEWTGK